MDSRMNGNPIKSKSIPAPNRFHMKRVQVLNGTSSITATGLPLVNLDFYDVRSGRSGHTGSAALTN